MPQDLNIQLPNPDELGRLSREFQGLEYQQAGILAKAKEVNAALRDQQNTMATYASAGSRSIAQVGNALKTANIAGSLQATTRLARLEGQALTKSLADQAAAVAGHYRQLAGTMANFAEARSARVQETIARQMDALNTQVQATQENITFLQEAEANATGTRKENIQQQIALQQAQAASERQRIAQLEQQQKQAEARAAQRQKQLQLFSAIIDTAAAIAKANAAALPPANIPLIAFAAATGAAQIAAIAAQPIPKFRQGGIVPMPESGSVLRGPRHGQGGILIEAEGGERIFSREKSAQFAPLFDAIQKGQLSPLAPLIKGGSEAGGFAPAVTHELRALRADLGKLKQVHVNLDAKGFRVAEQTATRRTTILNQRYSS